MTAPRLDDWLADAGIRIAHRREANAAPAALWSASRSVRLSETRLLGRLVRWRIPGLPEDLTYDELFRAAPFLVLEEREHALVCGLCGRIWTLRRDYPQLASAEEFRAWDARGTVRVLYANWVEPAGRGRAVLRSETRVRAVDREALAGLVAVRPLIAASHQLIAVEALAVATRRAELDAAA